MLYVIRSQRCFAHGKKGTHQHTLSPQPQPQASQGERPVTWPLPVVRCYWVGRARGRRGPCEASDKIDSLGNALGALNEAMNHLLSIGVHSLAIEKMNYRCYKTLMTIDRNALTDRADYFKSVTMSLFVLTHLFVFIDLAHV